MVGTHYQNGTYQGPPLMVDVAGVYQYGVHAVRPGPGYVYGYRRHIPTGVVETFDLSTIAGNPLDLPYIDPGDGHFAMVCAPDADDVLHVVGNDHAQQNDHRYVVCTDVEDFTNPASWSEPPDPFGGLAQSAPGYTYNLFVRSPVGARELIWFLSQPEDDVDALGRDWLAFKRVAGEWEPLVGDGHFATTRTGAEGNPLDGTEAIAAYVDALNMRADGTLEVVTHWRTADGDLTQLVDPVYIRSTSADWSTWETAAGVAQAMPITWQNREATATVITGNYVPVNHSLCSDDEGRPEFVIDMGYPVGDFERMVWDGDAWGLVSPSSVGYPDPTGVKFYTARRDGELYALRLDPVLGTIRVRTADGARRRTMGPPQRSISYVVWDRQRLLEQGVFSFQLGGGSTPEFYEWNPSREAKATAV